MISFQQISLSIEEKNLFNEVNITLLPSCILFIKGANGSGKTSFLRMVAGLKEASRGNIFLTKKAIPLSNVNKPYCLYINHELGLKLELTVFENLKFWSSLYNSLETLKAAIHYFNLATILDSKCYQLSAGNQKKVALAKLIACQSNIWLLDEVETNLDQSNRKLLHNLIISKVNNGGIILIATNEEPFIKNAQILNIEDFI